MGDQTGVILPMSKVLRLSQTFGNGHASSWRSWWPDPHVVLDEAIECLGNIYQIWSSNDASPYSVAALVDTIVVDGAKARRVVVVKRLVVVYVAIGR